MPTASQHYVNSEMGVLTHIKPLSLQKVWISLPTGILSSAAVQRHGNPQVTRLGRFHDNLKPQNMPMQPQQKFSHLRFLYKGCRWTRTWTVGSHAVIGLSRGTSWTSTTNKQICLLLNLNKVVFLLWMPLASCVTDQSSVIEQIIITSSDWKRLFRERNADGSGESFSA